MTKPNLITPSPHLHLGTTVSSDMWNVVKALMPALLVAVALFGLNALILTIYGVIAAVITEALILYLRKKPIVINDGSAVLTGILVSFGIHSGVPWWIPVAGSVFAIAIGKHAFGGLGCNILNPALLGRVFLVVSWPVYMTSNWVKTNAQSISGILNQNIDHLSEQITSATPLKLIDLLNDPNFIESLGENGHAIVNNIYSMLLSTNTLVNIFIGNIGGCIGEVSAAALILGGIFLILKRVIDWRVPFFYVFTVFILTGLLASSKGHLFAPINLVIFHLITGGLMLGALFMATDPVTSPISKKGKIIFAIGCGLITVVIRLYSGYPEGVSFAILVMNLFVPIIDKYTYSRRFGRK